MTDKADKPKKPRPAFPGAAPPYKPKPKPKPKGAGAMGGKPSTATPYDRRLRDNATKPPHPPKPGKPMKPGKP